MEIEGENGWRTELREGLKVLGRGLGFRAAERTVSRCHVSFELLEGSKRGVRFEVIGKNPIWVLSSGSGEIRVFRRQQGGEMESGDSFCVSSGNPIWFSLKRIEFPEMGLCGVDSLNVSDIDPVKEFGFIVMGHEFESYPKRMVRGIKTWNWFLEEPSRNCEEDDDDDDDDEDSGKKRQRSRRGKRKQAEEGNGCYDEEEDDEWMGEGDEGKELVAKIRTNQRPKCSTRSKEKKKKIRSSKKPTNQASRDDNEYETEDEDTLGGFIVNDGEEENEEEEEEEDYDEGVEEMDE